MLVLVNGVGIAVMPLLHTQRKPTLQWIAKSEKYTEMERKMLRLANVLQSFVLQ